MYSVASENRHLQLVDSASGNTNESPTVVPLPVEAAVEFSDDEPARRADGRFAAALIDTFADYQTALDGSPLAPDTRRKYGQRVTAYLDWMLVEHQAGRLRGDPLTEPRARDWAVRDYRRSLKARKLEATTINNTLAALDDFHVRLGIGPAVIRREDPPARTAPVALSAAATRRYLREIERTDSVRDKVIAALPYYAGLRIAEVVGLDVADIALSARKGTVRVVGKGRDGGKVRKVPVHAELRVLLQTWLDARRDWPGAETTPALLLNTCGGRIGDRAARTIITTLGDSAGITSEKFGPHVLRHTFATQLLRGGADVVLVAELLGHARLDNTRLYTLPTDNDRAAAVDRLITDN